MAQNGRIKALLISPEYPDTFWNFRYALKFIGKKTVYPPLGLLTVASLLPKAWDLKFVDMNISKLRDEDLRWADLVLVSAIVVQQKSVKELVSRCKEFGVKIVAGGPYFTGGYDDFSDIDHLILNEAEITLPRFLRDFGRGEAKHVYRAKEEWADITTTPLPRWDLLAKNRDQYAQMNIQYSRGCPYNCDFCDITVLYGHLPRTKTKEQIIFELDALHQRGWRGHIFIVDDNFVGNKRRLKKEILPAIIKWQLEHKSPFRFGTQASIDMADDEELMQKMLQAGFSSVFVGIETPNQESLEECAKAQNRNRDLVAAVNRIQRLGFRVQGGFIVGFDHDPESIFDNQIDFINKTNIVTALIGTLRAPRGTKLYKRLKAEDRLVTEDPSGDNSDADLNFKPRMGREKLMRGYRRVLATVYSPDNYYRRIKSFIRQYKTSPLLKKYKMPKRRVVRWPIRMYWTYSTGFFKSLFYLGFLSQERRYYWPLMFWSLFRRPRCLAMASTLAVYGFHFRKVFEKMD